MLYFKTKKSSKALSSIRKHRISLRNIIKPTVDNNNTCDLAEPATLQDVVQELSDAGILAYLKSEFGGSLGYQSTSRSLKYCARYLIWSYKHKHSIDLPVNHTMVWFREVSTMHYTLLMHYSIYLDEQLKFKPSTIKNRAADILTCCKWFTLYADCSIRLSHESLTAISDVMKQIRKIQNKKERYSRARCTLADKIYNREMPSGGIAELRSAVEARLKWALQIRNTILNKDLFNQFMGVMYSSLYVNSAQGRVSGVMDITLSQSVELLQDGFATTDKFKTNSKWGLQAVSIDATSRQLITEYITFIRPQVAHYPINPNSALFLTFTGHDEKAVGRSVTRFFRRELDLKITTTSIRSMVETEMDKMYKQGKISNEERLAVQTINGHTSAVTKDYYICEDRKMDVFHARNAFNALHDTISDLDDDTQSTPSDSSSAHKHSEANVAADFGTEHPDYHLATAKRVRWTREEVLYIGKWCDQQFAINPNITNIVAKCRNYILKDPAALPIFHKIHVLDSGRLRNGHRIYYERGIEYTMTLFSINNTTYER